MTRRRKARNRATGVVIAMLPVCLGCSSIFGSEDPNLTLRFDADPAIFGDTSFDLDVGRRRFSVGPEEMTETHYSRLGDVPVRIELKRAGEVIAADSFSLQFHEDADHWIFAAIRPSAFLGDCMGEVSAYPLPALTDSLYVARGGLRRDVIC